MTIIIRCLVSLVICQQAIGIIRHPTGPTFISTTATKPKLYYNNTGIRLDCSAVGNPPPILTWFRMNSNDEQSWIKIESSEFIQLYDNGSLFIRPFRNYTKTIHAGTFICRAENAAGSIQTLPIHIKPQIYDTYDIEVKNAYGLEQSSVTVSCEISPPSTSSYLNIVGWLEKNDNRIIQLDLKPKTKYNLLANKNLIIHNLSKYDDNKSYACIVHNQIDNHTRQSRFKSLRVRNRSPFGPDLSVINNTEYRAENGDTVEIPCGITSLPNNAQISWLKDGVQIENIEHKRFDSSLILSSLSLNDSGYYLCEVDDESIGRITSLVSLKVHLPIKCDINAQYITVDAGSNVELICNINSRQNSFMHWQWHHNSILLPNQLNQYKITNATREHMGMYQCCYVSNSIDLDSCCAQTQLRVTNSPPFILTESSIHLNSIIIIPDNKFSNPIDFNLTLYGDPMPEVTLYKDGRQLLGNYSIDYLSSGDIFLHYPIYISDINETGLYECHARNSFGLVSLSKHININKQKPFIQPLSNQTIHIGEQVTLTCYASGQPNLHLQWIDMINNEIVNTSLTSPILFTSTTTKSKVYACQAINSYGRTSSQSYVFVRRPAKILTAPFNQTVKLHSKLKLSCTAEGDNQLELIFKSPSFNNTNLIENKYDHKKKLSIMIDNVQMFHSGLYGCYAKNNYSQDYSLFEIIVETIPDKIEHVFIDNSQKLSWIKPFDGNSKILKYILRIQSKQGFSWSNETILIIDNSNATYHVFENIFSKCLISVRVQAQNMIGSSLPSEPLYFQTKLKHLQIAPYNLSITNVSSKSLILTWQYPLLYICNDSLVGFVIEITDQYNQTVTKYHNHHSTNLMINQLKSFAYYSLVIYAMNELGPSPKSKPIKIKTLESVPRSMIVDLKANPLNESTVHITWTLEQDSFQFLNGKFRTFLVVIYENFNMSTLTNRETIKTNLMLHNLLPSSNYFISVSVCNYYDCGSSSSTIDVTTPPSTFGVLSTILHPINKPLVLDCPHSINNSLEMIHSTVSENLNQHQCGSKLINVQYYDKPSFIRAKIHYTMSNEIGLKLIYPLEIVESVTITYKIKEKSSIYELNISPPLLNIRLSNLSCGNTYEIMIYGSNQAGFSSTEYLVVATDGSVPSLIESKSLLRTIGSNHIILNMANWIINECRILSYDIEIFPLSDSNENRPGQYFNFENAPNEIEIDHLQSDQNYEMNIKVYSQAGNKNEKLYFRTPKTNNEIKITHQQILALLFLTTFSFLLILILIIIIIKLCRQNLTKTKSLVEQRKTFRPILFSSKSQGHYHKTWTMSDDDRAIKNSSNNKRSLSFSSEDSQGNINPYAVTGDMILCKDASDHAPVWKNIEYDHHQLNTTTDMDSSQTPIERYFRPIIIESSIFNDESSSQKNPLVKKNETKILSNGISTMDNKTFSTFTYIATPKSMLNKTANIDQSLSSADSGVHSSYTQSPRFHLNNYSFDHTLSTSNQDNPLYVTYDEANADSFQHKNYSLV